MRAGIKPALTLDNWNSDSKYVGPATVPAIIGQPRWAALLWNNKFHEESEYYPITLPLILSHPHLRRIFDKGGETIYWTVGPDTVPAIIGQPQWAVLHGDGKKIFIRRACHNVICDFEH
jgi:hypothetical protein